MGQAAEILLVSISQAIWQSVRIFSVLMLAGCSQNQDPVNNSQSEVVTAVAHDQFWLWAGVKPQPVLDQAKVVYILDSELRLGDDRLTPLRSSVPRIKDIDIWMVVRVETLDWNAGTYDQLLRRLSRWRTANRLVGLQIDFDAATKGLDEYAMFLIGLCDRLPGDVQLGITGLLDWSAHGDPQTLNDLANVVDDIVIQTYQGRSTIAGYEDYLAGLENLDISYKIGLVQGGEWREPQFLRGDADFNGYVVFLVNPEKRK